MFMRLTVTALVVLTMAPLAARAERIYCAADDEWVKLSIEGGFSARPSKRLVHFRGAMTLKQPPVPGLFPTMRLNASMLRQYWVDDRDLKFRIYSESKTEAPFVTLDMSIVTKGAGADMQANRYSGRYSMALTASSGRKAKARDIDVARGGTLVCQIK